MERITQDIGRVLRAIMGDNMNPGTLSKFQFCQGGRRSRLENPPGFQPCSIVKLATNRFARADLEGKLLMEVPCQNFQFCQGSRRSRLENPLGFQPLDEDMNMSALPDTNILKAIITMEERSTWSAR